MHFQQPGRTRGRALLLAALTAVTALSLTGLPTAASAATVPPTGADVGWPSCPVGMGIPERPTKGEPMPADNAAFVILGLTNGPAFSPNPCLASQVGWAAQRHTPAAAYAVTSYPTAAELATYGGAGRLTQRLYIVGVAQAAYNVRTMRAAGMRGSMIWTDAEPVPNRPSSRIAKNNALVDGLLAGYTSAGIRNGFYSYSGGWTSVLGSRRSFLPVWATAGKSTRTSAQSRCATANFSSGPVLLSHWYDDHYDWDLTCPGVSATDPALFAYQGPIGSIAALWNSLGGFGSVLGAPTSGELGASDGVRRHTRFVRGSVYWTPAGGAHAVVGAIHGKWAELGFERSALGCPTTNETPVAGGAYSRLQSGSISWSAAARI